MNKRTLSVVVPVYNVEKYLNQCIDSIIHQTYLNLEIILVDDGSTDTSGTICDTYAKQDHRICVIHKMNGGLISARIAGVRKSRSEFITFVDGDDWIDPLMYEKLMQKMIEFNVDLVTSGCIRYFDENNQIESYDTEIQYGLYDEAKIEEHIIPIMLWKEEINKWAIDPSLCTKIFRRTLLNKMYDNIQEKKFYYGEDTAVLFPYMLEIKSMFYMKGAFYFHRQREGKKAPEYLVEDMFFDKLVDLYHILYNAFFRSRYKNCLIKQLDFFYIKSVHYHSLKYKIDYDKKYGAKRIFLFPFCMIPMGSNIILYGAGNIGVQYFKQIKQLNYCNIILWVDKKFADKEEYIIESPELIKYREFDYIVIAILNEDSREEIKNQIVGMGIKEERIITHIPAGCF